MDKPPDPKADAPVFDPTCAPYGAGAAPTPHERGRKWLNRYMALKIPDL